MKTDKKPLIIILFVALALRLAALGAAPLWYDETFTAWVSSIPLNQMLSALSGDVHPPLYYLVTWAAVHVTGATSPHDLALVLRAVSIPFSLWAVYLTYQIGRALNWDRRATLAAAGFTAVGPLQIFFAQEARMYAIFQAFVLLAFLGVIRAATLTSYENGLNWFYVSLGLFVALWVHNYGLIYWGALFLISVYLIISTYKELKPNQKGIGLITRATKYNVKRFLLAFFIPLVLWIPWVVVLLGQMSTVAAGYWLLPPTLGDILAQYHYILGGIIQHKAFHALAVMCVFGSTIYTLYMIGKKRPNGWPPLALFGFLPLVVAVVGSYLWKPILLYRPLIPSSVALALLIGWALTLSRRSALISLALIAPMITSSLYFHYTNNPKISNNDVAATVDDLRAEWQPGDIVYHIDSGSMVGWWLYARDLPQYKAPPACEAETLGGLSPATRAGLGIIEKDLSEIEYNRAWVVYAIGPTVQPCLVDRYGHYSDGPAWKIGENSEFILSGVWLHGR